MNDFSLRVSIFRLGLGGSFHPEENLLSIVGLPPDETSRLFTCNNFSVLSNLWKYFSNIEES